MLESTNTPYFEMKIDKQVTGSPLVVPHLEWKEKDEEADLSLHSASGEPEGSSTARRTIQSFPNRDKGTESKDSHVCTQIALQKRLSSADTSRRAQRRASVCHQPIQQMGKSSP